MAEILQWMGLAFGIAVVAFGVTGFFRGLSLPRTALNIVRTARVTTGAPDFAGARWQAATKFAGLCDLSHGVSPRSR
jgi:hypothetical protein